MKGILIIICTVLSCHLPAHAQDWKTALKKILRSCDSVKIVSHKTTSAIRITEQDRDQQDLIRRGRLNESIINMMRLVDRRSIDSISEILTRTNRDKQVEIIKSFTPHHGIIIYEKGFISFLDIDFLARQIHTSEEVHIEENLSSSSWKDLEKMFKGRKFDF
jgi:hypothetical protein